MATIVDEFSRVGAEGMAFVFELEEGGLAVWGDEEGRRVPGWVGDAVADGPAG